MYGAQKKIISDIVFIFIFLNDLTYKQLETHMCILSIVATDGLVVKHQAISSYSAD